MGDVVATLPRREVQHQPLAFHGPCGARGDWPSSCGPASLSKQLLELRPVALSRGLMHALLALLCLKATEIVLQCWTTDTDPCKLKRKSETDVLLSVCDGLRENATVLEPVTVRNRYSLSSSSLPR